MDLLSPLTCGLISCSYIRRGSSTTAFRSSILRFAELYPFSDCGVTISPRGWLGRRVFGLTLMLRSLSLCDLLCCSLVEVLCECGSYVLGVLGSLGIEAGDGWAGDVW